MPIQVEIVSQDRMVYKGEADLVLIPGVEGEFGVLPNHSPLLSTMQLGVLKVRSQGEEREFTITGGIVEVQPDIVNVLADAAENVEEIDVARAEAARERAERLLHDKGKALDAQTYLALQAALRRSNLRLEAVKKYRKIRRQTGISDIGDLE